jgi:hypothetical protein
MPTTRSIPAGHVNLQWGNASLQRQAEGSPLILIVNTTMELSSDEEEASWDAAMAHLYSMGYMRTQILGDPDWSGETIEFWLIEEPDNG